MAGRPTYAQFPQYRYQQIDSKFIKYTNIPFHTKPKKPEETASAESTEAKPEEPPADETPAADVSSAEHAPPADAPEEETPAPEEPPTEAPASQEAPLEESGPGDTAADAPSQPEESAINGQGEGDPAAQPVSENIEVPSAPDPPIVKPEDQNDAAEEAAPAASAAAAAEVTDSAAHEPETTAQADPPLEVPIANPPVDAPTEITEEKNEDSTAGTIVSEDHSSQEPAPSKVKKAKKVVVKAPPKSSSAKNKKPDNKEKSEKVEKTEKPTEKPKAAIKGKKNAKPSKKKGASAVAVAAAAAIGAVLVDDAANPIEDSQSKADPDKQPVDTGTEEGPAAGQETIDNEPSATGQESSETVQENVSTDIPSAEVPEPTEATVEAEKAVVDSSETTESKSSPSPAEETDPVKEPQPTIQTEQVPETAAEEAIQPSADPVPANKVEEQAGPAEELTLQEPLAVPDENEPKTDAEPIAQPTADSSPVAEVESTNEAATEHDALPVQTSSEDKADVHQQTSIETVEPVIISDVTAANEADAIPPQTEDSIQMDTVTPESGSEKNVDGDDSMPESSKQEIQLTGTTENAAGVSTPVETSATIQEEIQTQESVSVPEAPIENPSAATEIPEATELESAEQASKPLVEQSATLEQGPVDQSSEPKIADIVESPSTLLDVDNTGTEMGVDGKDAVEADDSKMNESKLDQDTTVTSSNAVVPEDKQTPEICEGNTAADEHSNEAISKALSDAQVGSTTLSTIERDPDGTSDPITSVDAIIETDIKPESEPEIVENNKNMESASSNSEAELQSHSKIDPCTTEGSPLDPKQEVEAAIEPQAVLEPSQETSQEPEVEADQESVPAVISDAVNAMDQDGDTKDEAASMAIPGDSIKHVAEVPAIVPKTETAPDQEVVGEAKTLLPAVSELEKVAVAHDTPAADVGDVETKDDHQTETHDLISADIPVSEDSMESSPAAVADVDQGTASAESSNSPKIAEPPIAEEDHKDEPSPAEPTAEVAEAGLADRTEIQPEHGSSEITTAMVDHHETGEDLQEPSAQIEDQAEAIDEDMLSAKGIQEAEMPKQADDTAPDGEAVPEVDPGGVLDDTDNRSTAAVCDDHAAETDPMTEAAEAILEPHNLEENVPGSPEEESKATESATLNSVAPETEPTELGPEIDTPIEKEVPLASSLEDRNTAADTPPLDEVVEAVPLLSASDKERERKRHKRRSTAEAVHRHHESHHSDSRTKDVHVVDTSKRPKDSHSHRAQDAQFRRHKNIDPISETDPHLESIRDPHDAGHIKVHKSRPKLEEDRKPFTRGLRTSEVPTAERPKHNRTDASYRSAKADHGHQKDTPPSNVFGLNALGRVLRPKLFTGNRAQTEIPKTSRGDIPKQERPPAQEKSSPTEDSPRSPTAPKMRRSQSDQKPSLSEEEAARRAAHARRKERDAEKAANADATRRAARREAHRLERDKTHHRTEPGKPDRPHRRHKDRSDSEGKADGTAVIDENIGSPDNNEAQRDLDQAVEDTAELSNESPPHHHHQHHHRHRQHRNSSYEKEVPHSSSDKEKNPEKSRSHRRASYLGDHPRKGKVAIDSSGPSKRPEPATGPVGLLKRIFRD